MLQHKSIFNVPFSFYTKLIKIFLNILPTVLHWSILYFFLLTLVTTIIIDMLHSTQPLSLFFIVGADQELMSSIRGLPSGYAVLYYMLDAQLFLSLSPYLRESTVCCKHDSLGVTQVAHQCMGYKPLDLTLFSWTGFDYIWHGMSHNPPKTTTKISSTYLHILWFMVASDTHIDSRSCFFSSNFHLLVISSKNRVTPQPAWLLTFILLCCLWLFKGTLILYVFM